MEKNTLTEIKKGQTGTGLLIEHEGYISSDCGDNKKLFEDINSKIGTDEPICPEHFIVSAVFQKFGIENANGRIYPEHVLKREVEKYMEKIAEMLNYSMKTTVDTLIPILLELVIQKANALWKFCLDVI